jgi:hypothetical protein
VLLCLVPDPSVPLPVAVNPTEPIDPSAEEDSHTAVFVSVPDTAVESVVSVKVRYLVKTAVLKDWYIPTSEPIALSIS